MDQAFRIDRCASSENDMQLPHYSRTEFSFINGQRFVVEAEVLDMEFVLPAFIMKLEKLSELEFEGVGRWKVMFLNATPSFIETKSDNELDSYV